MLLLLLLLLFEFFPNPSLHLLDFFEIDAVVGVVGLVLLFDDEALEAAMLRSEGFLELDDFPDAESCKPEVVELLLVLLGW